MALLADIKEKLNLLSPQDLQTKFSVISALKLPRRNVEERGGGGGVVLSQNLYCQGY